MTSAVSEPKDQPRGLESVLEAMVKIAQTGLSAGLATGLSTLREVVVRGSQAGRLRVDLALLSRERSRLLSRLGEVLVTLVDKGALELNEDARRIYDELRDVDARIAADSVASYDNSFGAQRGAQAEVGDYYSDSESDSESSAGEAVATPRDGK